MTQIWLITYQKVMNTPSCLEFRRQQSTGILGPLYADERGRFVRFIPAGVLDAVASRKGVVPWLAHRPTWTRYEESTRQTRLVQMIEERGGRVFLSSADAMAVVREWGGLCNGLASVV